MRLAVGAVCLVAAAGFRLHGQASSSVSYERLSAAAAEPQNWLTYSGTYHSQRYSLLDQITPANVRNLEQKWVYQAPVVGNVAGDAARRRRHHVRHAAAERRRRARRARRGASSGSYRHVPAADHNGLLRREQSRPRDSRRHAVHGRRSTRSWWRSTRGPAADSGNVQVTDYKLSYSMTLAPLVVKDKVIVGVGGGDLGIRGFIAAYDAQHRARRSGASTPFPGPGEPGHETWEACPAGSSPSLTRPELLRSRGLEARRRRDLAHRLLRSRAQSHVLGRRQRVAGLQPVAAPWRQPVRRVGRRARCRYGQAPVALPVHAERTNTTTTPCRSRSWPTWTGAARPAS